MVRREAVCLLCRRFWSRCMVSWMSPHLLCGTLSLLPLCPSCREAGAVPMARRKRANAEQRAGRAAREQSRQARRAKQAASTSTASAISAPILPQQIHCCCGRPSRAGAVKTPFCYSYYCFCYSYCFHRRSMSAVGAADDGGLAISRHARAHH